MPHIQSGFTQPDFSQPHDTLPANRKNESPRPLEALSPAEALEPFVDYVNAFVMNKDGDILILEVDKNGRSWASWQMIGKGLKEKEDPILAVQQELLQRTGYTCREWIYLGSFINDEAQKQGAGYFFCAKAAEQIAAPQPEYSRNITLKWVSKREMKRALLDGRIALLTHAVAASLALAMCPRR